MIAEAGLAALWLAAAMAVADPIKPTSTEAIAALKARNPDWAEAAMSAHLFSILNDPAPADPD